MNLFCSFVPRRSLISCRNGSRTAPNCFARWHSTANHRDLAQSQKLLTNSIYSPGSPLFLPNGADMLNKLTACLRAHYPAFGFREVVTPSIYKQSLWQMSGHWDKYAEHMFAVHGRESQSESFGLKPMNCPGHCLMFASQTRSYRELPIRYADFGALHRNEVEGSLTGLTRVRRFHQDDGHIFCRPGQIEEEIGRTMEFIRLVYGEIFGLWDYRLVLSTRPESDEAYIGWSDEWSAAEKYLQTALDKTGRPWSISAGDGAFYGPKIDVILKDAQGREHQTATIQLDFQLPKRFGLKYLAPTDDGSDEMGTEVPVLIHRAVFGSLERFLAILIEHYNGRYPFWISPHPVSILTVSQTPEELRYLQEVAAEIGGIRASSTNNRKVSKMPSHRPSIHVETDCEARSLGKKIVLAKQLGANFVVVIGPKDAQKGSVSLQISNQRDAERSLDILWELEPALKVSKPEKGTPNKVQTTPSIVRAYFETLQDQYM